MGTAARAVLSGILFRARRGVPASNAILLLGCVLTTAMLVVRPDLYLIVGAGNEQLDNPHLHWWHVVVTGFVHGGGFPGTTAHMVINGVMLVVLGGLLERALGTGRVFALWGACLVVGWVMKPALHRYAHGISNVTWAYVDFAPFVLAHAWRTERARALRDPAFIVVALLLAIGLIGLANPFHAIPMIVGIPFVLAFRGALRANLERVARGEAPDRWGPAPAAIGIVVAGLLAAFAVGMTVAAWFGVVR